MPRPEYVLSINQVAFRSLVNAVSAEPRTNSGLVTSEDRESFKAEEAADRHSPLVCRGFGRVLTLAKRMCTHLFNMRQDRVVLNPLYQGCGIINACFGDAISDTEHIIELKDGDRPFRSYEFRQITIYGALHLNATDGCRRHLLS